MTTRTRTLCIACALAVTVFAFPGDSSGQQVENRLALSATLASDYFSHGLTQTDGDGSWRLAADYTHVSGFFAGGFIANVEYGYESSFRSPRDLQIGYYAGFQAGANDWKINVAASRYRYPDLVRSYDFSQLLVNAAYRDRFHLGAVYSDEWLGVGGRGYGYELGITQPLEWNLELGVSIGRMHLNRFLGSSYTYWDAGLTRVANRFAVDFRYHNASLDRATLLGSPHGDRWVLSVSYAILPR